MRTTVEIPDQLYTELKSKAALEGSSVRALIVEAVSQSFASPMPRVRVQFPLIYGSGNQMVNPTNEQIEEAMAG